VDMLAIPFRPSSKVRRGTSNATVHLTTMVISFDRKASVAFSQRIPRARQASEGMVSDVDEELGVGCFLQN